VSAGLLAAVVFLMVVKPALLGALIALATGLTLGLLVALRADPSARRAPLGAAG
jgi:hypothetical protein